MIDREIFEFLKTLGPVGMEKLREFMSRVPHPSGAGLGILQIKSPLFQFEWHPQKRIVYLVRHNLDPVVAEAIATDIETHGAAIAACQIFSRGYHEGKATGVVKPALVNLGGG